MTRASWSLVMMFSFLFIIIYMQQNGCILLVFLLQIMMYKELINIGKRPEHEGQLPYMKLVVWWWFMVTCCLTYGIILEPHIRLPTINQKMLPFPFKQFKYFNGRYLNVDLNKFKKQIFEDGLYLYSFILYMIGLVFFVSTLKRKHYRYQFQ